MGNGQWCGQSSQLSSAQPNRHPSGHPTGASQWAGQSALQWAARMHLLQKSTSGQQMLERHAQMDCSAILCLCLEQLHFCLTLKTVRCRSFCCDVGAAAFCSISEPSCPNISRRRRPTSGVMSSRPCSPKLCVCNSNSYNSSNNNSNNNSDGNSQM